ncbi:MAG: hypothetical protein JNL73_04465, partial [Anaerolineales bacterium]|nr:hypothetical protein [Anaerolineales bacterium]
MSAPAPAANERRRRRPVSRRRSGCLGPLAIGLALGVAVPLLGLIWAQAVDTVGPAPLLIAYASLPWLLPIAGLFVLGLA